MQMSIPVVSKMRNGKRGFSPRRALRYQWLRLLRLKGDPLTIARGIAVGTFIGVTPTIPFHTSLTILFCWIFRANLIAALILNWLVSNPLTIPMEYYLSWKIGSMLVGSTIGSWKEVQDLLSLLRHSSFVEAVEIVGEKGLGFFGSMTLGGVILGIPLAIASYMAYLKWFFYRQKRKYKRFLEKSGRK